MANVTHSATQLPCSPLYQAPVSIVMLILYKCPASVSLSISHFFRHTSKWPMGKITSTTQATILKKCPCQAYLQNFFFQNCSPNCVPVFHYHSNQSVKYKESIIISQTLRYSVLHRRCHPTTKKVRFPHSLSWLDKILWILALTTSSELSPTPEIPFFTKPPGYQILKWSFQLSPYTPKR